MASACDPITEVRHVSVDAYDATPQLVATFQFTQTTDMGMGDEELAASVDLKVVNRLGHGICVPFTATFTQGSAHWEYQGSVTNLAAYDTVAIRRVSTATAHLDRGVLDVQLTDSVKSSC